MMKIHGSRCCFFFHFAIKALHATQHHTTRRCCCMSRVGPIHGEDPIKGVDPLYGVQPTHGTDPNTEWIPHIYVQGVGPIQGVDPTHTHTHTDCIPHTGLSHTWSRSHIQSGSHT